MINIDCFEPIEMHNLPENAQFTGECVSQLPFLIWLQDLFAKKCHYNIIMFIYMYCILDEVYMYLSCILLL